MKSMIPRKSASERHSRLCDPSIGKALEGYALALAYRIGCIFRAAKASKPDTEGEGSFVLDRKRRPFRRVSSLLSFVAGLMAATNSFAFYLGEYGYDGVHVYSLKETMTEGESDFFFVAPRSYVGSIMNLWTSDKNVTLEPSRFTYSLDVYNNGGGKIAITVAHDADLQHETVNIYFKFENAFGRIEKDNVGVTSKTIKVIDDDIPTGRIRVSPVDRLTIDQGQSGTLSVSLDTAPSENTTVLLSKTDPLVTLLPSALTFTPLNYSTAQSVTVIVNENGEITTDMITLTIPEREGLSAPSVTKAISVIPITSYPGAIEVSPAGTLSIDEGGSKTLSVRLSAAPRRNATVSLSSSNSDVTLSLVSLFFTPSNYSIPQSVSVGAAQDLDGVDDFASITLKASGGITASDVMKDVIVIDDDSSGSSAPPGNIVLLPSGVLKIGEGERQDLEVGLISSSAIEENVTIVFTTTNPDITITPSYLTFTPLNHSSPQSVSVSAKEDPDFVNESALITAEASGGIAAPSITKGASIMDNDENTSSNGDDVMLVIVPEGAISSDGAILIDEEGEGAIDIHLSSRPSSDASVVIRKSPISDTGIDLSLESMTFTPSNWSKAQSLRVLAHDDPDKEDNTHTITFDFEGETISQAIIVKDNDKTPMKAQALALPPSGSKDDVILRIQCKQNAPCDVSFKCSAQSDGSLFEGDLPEAIPAYGATSITLSDIERYTGGDSWSGKGRLGCSLLSDADIGSQVWTRSGNGVLVNNSAMIRSVTEGDIHRADIESIPSPDSSDESNIRIRCNSDSGHCLDTVFLCYLDDGTKYDWELGRIDRLTTRHIQSEELAAGIGYRWPGLGLACEVRSSGQFTAQVLTRTGTGALINNSATGK
ncbi:hypothetical protein [Thioalkalivibrio sp. HK1]|uniref:hypothetical protein n=1 Tax=Thioalkalivibrio sp. HK1 TaxID=1469245 RepID=UPI0004707BD8|nr:hypothetical protein [Thioalkalivibrio sp. HK1]